MKNIPRNNFRIQDFSDGLILMARQLVLGSVLLAKATEYADSTSAEGVSLLFLNDCPGYNTKFSSDGEGPVPELWRMWSIPSLTLLTGSLWPGLVAPVRVLSMVQIELFNHLPMIIIISYLKAYNCVQIICIRSQYLINRITNVK